MTSDELRMTSDKLYPRMNYFFSFVIRHSSLVISLCAALVAAAQTDFSLTGWRYWTALDPPKPNLAGESFVRVTLSPSILAQALPGLEDLRIVDDSAAVVPYALLVEGSRQKETRVPVTIVDPGVVPGEYQQLVCNLGPNASASNEIHVETASRNFRRRVDVLASADRRKWVDVKLGSHIFDQHEEFVYQNLRLVYPETTYRYIQLRMWLDGGEPLKITGVRVSRVVRKEVLPERMAARIVRREEDADRKATDLLFEADQANPHADACIPAVAQENFQRRAEIAWRDGEGIWRSSGAADIYRFKIENQFEENLRIPLAELTAREARLRIWNQDSPPLDVVSIVLERMPRVVVFSWNPRKNYRLFLGCSTAKRPFYDVEPVVRRLDVSDLPRCEGGAVMPNAAFKEPKESRPWTEKHPVLLWTGLCVGVLLLGWILLRTLREMKT